MSQKPPQENPLHNILINVILPVFALSSLSKEGDKFWHIGPLYGIILAVLPPLAYGIHHFWKTKKANVFSMLGIVSVLLTGGLTIYLWNKDGTIKPNAGILFGIKEASIPFILGLAVIFSRRSKSPLLNAFLYNDSLFNVSAIETTVAEKQVEPAYQKLLTNCTWLFAGSFAISTILNLLLAMHFLGELDHTAANAREIYNEKVAKITGWGFLVVGAPLLLILAATFFYLMRGLTQVTGIKRDDLLLPR
jgi:hypothetical protein